MKKTTKKKTAKTKTLPKKQVMEDKAKEEPKSLKLEIKPPEQTVDMTTSKTGPPKEEPASASASSAQPFFKTEVVDDPSFSKESQSSPVMGFSPVQTPQKPADDFQIFEPEEKKSSPSTVKLFFLFLLGFILGGTAVFVFFLVNPLNFVSNFQTSSEKNKEEATISPLPTMESKSKEATASEETDEGLDVSDLSIQILNGSGVSGAAARARDILQKDGFVTFSLGNAPDYEQASTEVKLKEDVKKEVFELIEKALTDYDLLLLDESLSSDSEFDIEITLGTKK